MSVEANVWVRLRATLGVQRQWLLSWAMMLIFEIYNCEKFFIQFLVYWILILFLEEVIAKIVPRLFLLQTTLFFFAFGILYEWYVIVYKSINLSMTMSRLSFTWHDCPFLNLFEPCSFLNCDKSQFIFVNVSDLYCNSDIRVCILVFCMRSVTLQSYITVKYLTSYWDY